MIGIYKFTNKINGKVYIGQSTNIDGRYHKHLMEINGERNTYFYNALRHYGIDNFSFEVILECPENELDYWEIYYIEYYRSYIFKYGKKYGYNMTPGGNGGNLGELVNKKISESNKKYFETHDVWNKGKTGFHFKMSDNGKKKISDISKGKRKMHLGEYDTWIYKDKIEDALLNGYEFGWNKKDVKRKSKLMTDGKCKPILIYENDITTKLAEGWFFCKRNGKPKKCKLYT